MSVEEFTHIINATKAQGENFYFHVMGEPTAHPHFADFLAIAKDNGVKVNITTNGTLLHKQQAMLLNAPGLHKVNISLHAFEANDLTIPFTEYLHRCTTFGQAAQGNKLVVYRLWNHGGAEARNEEILDALHHAFPGPWQQDRRGIRLGQQIFLEYGDKFDWPDLSATDNGSHGFCYGMRDQLGVLCDGTVVPCCLDHEGDIPLGNLFVQSMEDILATPRAKAIYEGFSNRTIVETLCRRCGYARRFS